jgi:hypothetical protein
MSLTPRGLVVPRPRHTVAGMGARVVAVERLRAAASAAGAHPFARVRFALLSERRADGVRGYSMEGIGIVDFRAWRCAVDFGAYALLFKEGRLWQGASGVSLSELGDPITPWASTPLLLLALVEAATDAREAGTEIVGDDECLRLCATADLSRLPVAHRPVPMPPESVPDPSCVAFDGCLSASGMLRRVRWRSAYQPSRDWDHWDELELVAFADEVEVDWTRTPLFKPPEDDDDLTPQEHDLLQRLADLTEDMDTNHEPSSEQRNELQRLAAEADRLPPPAE